MVLSRAWLDYTDPDTLRHCLSSHGTTVLINASGYTGRNVDDCESNRTECYQANTTTPILMAQVCRGLGATLLHVSSGCLFDGLGPFSETDQPDFADGRQFYSYCKASAEREIEESGATAFIFRIRMPFSHRPHPRNWLVKLANYEKILDGLNSVTWIDEFAVRSWQLHEKAPPGIYHCAQPEAVGTASVATMLNEAGVRKQPVEIFPPDIFLTKHVQRSATVLNVEKFEKAYGTSFTPTDVAIRWCIDRMKA